MTDVSIILVSWNAKTYLEECLHSLRQASGSLSREVIVVDNGSTDGSPEMISERFPEVILIQNGTNLGFARANNIGIRVATGKYICLVNSDVNVPPACLPAMYRYMEQNPEIGLLGPRMLGADGSLRRSTMRFPTIWHCFLRATALDTLFAGSGMFGGYLMFDFRCDRISDVDVLNGWFWIARRKALETVGRLDERFFMYGEDIDWCRSFHNEGWRVVYFPEAEAVHYGGASSANAPARFYVEMQRANLLYWKKYHGPISVFVYWLMVWLNGATRAVGYGLVYLLIASARAHARFEIGRNLASLRWLMGISPVIEA